MRTPSTTVGFFQPNRTSEDSAVPLHHPTSHSTSAAHQHPGSWMAKLSHAHAQTPLVPSPSQAKLCRPPCPRDTRGTRARLSPPQHHMQTSCTAAPDRQTQQGDSGRASSATEAKNPVCAKPERLATPARASQAQHRQTGTSKSW